MSTIESVLKETRRFEPSEAFRTQANVSGMEQYNQMCAGAHDEYEAFWVRLAKELITWKTPFTKGLDESNAPYFKWFEDGTLNASYNCIDRHLTHSANKIALILEKDNGDNATLTYQQLHDQVCQLANGLRAQGIQKGDRVVIYMPMGVEAVIAMQACARIGAIHSVVFGGFSAAAIRDRVEDAQAKVIITANESVRGGKHIPLKETVDEAMSLGAQQFVKQVIVFNRTDIPVHMTDGVDITWDQVIKGQPNTCEPEWMNAEDPLFILYTSGSTGKPKGIQHSTAGYLLGAINSINLAFDAKPDTDIFWCTADVGWITGHTYVCYGPLALGMTQVVFEGIPTYPDSSRSWQIIEKHKVTILYTAPTAIRSLIKLGGDSPKNHDLSSLRLLGTVGEPINPEAWMWYYENVGGSRCPIVDTWWQTETGSAMIAPLPGAVAAKPGSCTLPLPGILADIVDEAGSPVELGKGGYLVIKRPFPSLARTIWNDDARFKSTYFPEELGGRSYLAGDSAHRDEHGYFWIMGRIDDVLNVSGHRLGTMEIESALVANPAVAEAAVVGKPHEVKGESVVAFVVLKQSLPEGEEAKQIAAQLKQWVAHEIGKIAQPDEIRFGENLPKTRSGKIMRRLLRGLARDEELTQDTSTLENPQILEQLKKAV